VDVGVGECAVRVEHAVMGGSAVFRVHRCHYREVRKAFVQDFPLVLRAGLVHDPAETAPQHIASYSLIAVTTPHCMVYLS
jgi:hypothetical protein